MAKSLEVGDLYCYRMVQLFCMVGVGFDEMINCLRQSIVNGQWSIVNGQWSIINGQYSHIGHWELNIRYWILYFDILFTQQGKHGGLPLHFLPSPPAPLPQVGEGRTLCLCVLFTFAFCLLPVFLSFILHPSSFFFPFFSLIIEKSYPHPFQFPQLQSLDTN